MTNALNQRLEELCQELRVKRGAARSEALEHLSQVIRQMEIKGQHPPKAARELLASAIEADAEDRFDNMPI